MKKLLYVSSIMVMVLLSFSSCKKDNEVIHQENELALNEKSDYSEDCGYVDGYWGPNAYIDDYIKNSTQTSFMYAQSGRIANLFGVPSVVLRFVHDNTSQNSTANAISYSDGRIYYGETLYDMAMNYGKIATVMVLAHEYGHQVQYHYSGVPSVQESTARSRELESDGYAGYYMRRGYNASWAQAGPGFNFAYSIGDYSTNSQGHHGTPPQRRSATRLGWYLGKYSMTATDFDYYFFYYYTRYVLPGSLRPTAKPARIRQDVHNFILTKVEELRKLHRGQLSAEDFENLSE